VRWLIQTAKWHLPQSVAALVVVATIIAGASCTPPSDAVVREDAQRLLDRAFSVDLRATIQYIRPREGDDQHAEMRAGFTVAARARQTIGQGCLAGTTIEPDSQKAGGEIGLLYRKVGGEWRLISHKFLCTDSLQSRPVRL
jgi:hypothetical protein